MVFSPIWITVTLQKFTNGYDPALKPIQEVHFSKFTMAYFGNLKKNQSPRGLYDALIEIEKRQPDIAKRVQLLFYGSVYSEFKEELSKNLTLISVKFEPFVKHQKMIDLMNGADLLLYVVGVSKNSRFVLPTKALEYLTTGKPIMGIGQREGTTEEFTKKDKTRVLFLLIIMPKGYMLLSFRNLKSGKME